MIPAGVPEAALRAAAPAAGRPLRALVLDDSDFDRRRLIRAAAQAGLPMLFAEAASLAAMRAVLGARRHDLVFLDHGLPDGDGFLALAALRADPAHRTAPALMFTGAADPAIAAEALRRGCAGHIGKATLTPGLLRATVAAALGEEGPGPGRLN